MEAVRYICQKYGFAFSKDLGQNFLVDPRIPESIADGACIEGKNVLEIGPGMGTLTASLARRARKVVALELDRNLLPVLEETLAPWDNAEVVWGDVLKTDLAALADEKFGPGAPVSAVSNLPYCVTTPAILRILETGRFESLTVMIQKEAAKKLTAAQGEAEWCLFSALANRYAEVKKLFNVTKGCFYPQPKVDSTVLHLACRLDMSPEESRAYETVARALFFQRRKTARNTLAAVPEISAYGVELLLKKAEIDPSRRGESLSPAEIQRISGLMVQTIQKNPLEK